MSYSCKILLDSISETNKRITTFEITFPRIVLAEFNTHRMFSRNSASSRAIPFKKQIERLANDPFIPEQFPINTKGMQPEKYITKSDERYEDYVRCWKNAIEASIQQAKLLNELGIHKQILNRLLEPFQYHTVICTATEYDNFFKLRCNENAQYEIRRIADLMYEAYHLNFEYYQTNAWGGNQDWRFDNAAIKKLKVGEWHCPLVNTDSDSEDWQQISSYLYKDSSGHGRIKDFGQKFIKLQKQISVARCARVSYLTHDGKRDIEKDLELYEKLAGGDPKHASPLEHVATPHFLENMYLDEQLKGCTDGRLSEGFNYSSDLKYLNLRSGNFIGWKQYRKEFVDENCTNFRKEN